MSPPAAVSAMEIVSPRDLRRDVTSLRIPCSSTGGKAGVEVVAIALVWGSLGDG